MAQPNREIVRDAFYALLNTRLVTTDEIVEVCFTSRPDTFDGKSPVVTVTSAGSARERLAFGGSRENIAYLMVHIFVIYAASGWTHAEAEDRLDLIEATIADVVDANSKKTDNWNDLDYDGRSARIDVTVGGVPYIEEAIPIGVLMAYG